MTDEDKPLGDVVGDLVQEHHQEGMTANEDLRELVEEWRKRSDTLWEMHQRNGHLDMLGEIGQVDMLADELEKVIDE